MSAAICGYSLDVVPGVAALTRATLGYSVSNCANRGFAGATVAGHFA
jgi:hypothetical protein